MTAANGVAGKLVCFGEVLLRLSTPDYLPLADAAALNLHFAGAEANVAVQYAALGGEVSLVSRVPDNRVSEVLLEKLRARGVLTRGVLKGGTRLGLYFLEPGFGARASVITYDRAHSSMATVEPGMFDWEAALSGAEWFHWSGITPALGSHAPTVCAEAVGVARRLGVKISCDLNYRSALWSPDEAAKVMRPLVQGLDLCICGASEARSILGAPPGGEGDLLHERAASWVASTYGIGAVASPIRSGETAQGGTLRGGLFDGTKMAFSRTHELSVVDRIGAGDSFAGALLFAHAAGRTAQESVEFATAAAVWKHTVPGDWIRGSLSDIEALAAGAGGAVVKR
jgi:2-dehydro-3-deoxygluconokinase